MDNVIHEKCAPKGYRALALYLKLITYGYILYKRHPHSAVPNLTDLFSRPSHKAGRKDGVSLRNPTVNCRVINSMRCPSEHLTHTLIRNDSFNPGAPAPIELTSIRPLCGPSKPEHQSDIRRAPVWVDIN
ncbi:hypothetical protein AVEN_224630-1 [Araneus ventricosus]|uniref:Uncharacterized protein n=1 Tax=Araneus ventricosus TaxID=182803 RepID=A0A4Y2M8H2_ARAVE|nr:hypothetical protein AVEN_224630-1 [Araneus ventricosus]